MLPDNVASSITLGNSTVRQLHRQKSLTCQILRRLRFLPQSEMKSGRQAYHIKGFMGRYRYRPTKSPNVRPALYFLI